MRILTALLIGCCIAVLTLEALAGEEGKPMEKQPGIKDILLGKDLEAAGRLQMDLPQERHETIKDLVFVLNREPTKRSSPGCLEGYQSTAAYLLGQLRAEEPEAIKALADKIVEFTLVIGEKTMGTVYPCYGSLVTIGKPASLECLKRLATADGKKPKGRNIGRRELLLMVVRDVEGEEVAKFMLERAIAKEQDKKHKENLTAALELLEKWKKEREEHEKKWREKNKAETPAPSEPSEKPEE